MYIQQPNTLVNQNNNIPTAMNRITKEQVLKTLKDIESQIKRMDADKYIPQIEIDIALAKTRDLYESLQWFNQEEEIESAEPTYKPEIPVEEKVPDNIEEKIYVPQQKIENPPDPETITVKDHIIPDSPKIEETVIPETPPPVIKEKTPEKEVKSDDEIDFTADESVEEIIKKPVEMIVKDERKKPDLFDEPENGKKVSINEQILFDNPKTDLSEQIHKTPIKDLRDGIGVNDRFTYIRELFDGDVNRFNETVVILNNTENFKSAKDYMKKNFKWDVNSQAYIDFKDLVERKFIK